MGLRRSLSVLVIGFAVFFAFILACGGGGGGGSELAGNPNYVQSLDLIDDVYSLAFDGTNFWFAESEDWVYEMDQLGSIVSSFDMGPNTGGNGMTWDGSSLWVVGTSCSGYSKFIQYSTMGAVMDSFTNTDVTSGHALDCARGLAYFDSALWTDSGKIRAINIPSQSLRAGSIPSPVMGSTYLAFAGSDLWIIDDFREEFVFFHLDAFGSIIDSVQGQGADVHGLTWDGINMWTATWNSPPGFHAWDVY